MASECLVEIVNNVVQSKIKYESNYDSFAVALFEILRENGTKIVLVDNDSGRQWTANEVIDAIVTLGVKLTESGITKGDVVAFFCPNSDLHVIAKLTIWAIGAVYTGLIHKSPLRELNNIVTKTNATYLIGSLETIDICNKVMIENKTIKKFFVVDDNVKNNNSTIHAMVRGKVGNNEKEMFHQLMSNVKSNDLCKISFSSGTTGDPKGVLETHRRYISFIGISPPEIGLVTSADTCALLQPLPHAGGSVVLCLGLLNSSNLVVFSQFNVDTFIKDVLKYSITFGFIVPSYLNLLNKTVTEPLKNCTLKKVMTGGEFPQKFLMDEFIEKFKPTYLTQCYGCTETGLTTLLPVSEGTTNLKTAGIPLPGFRIKIIDTETSELLGAKNTGEICLKGPQSCIGYLNNDKANKEEFDDEWFFKSGDVGYYDDKGYVYITDRIKEIIKHNSQQVSPTELQSILLQHNSVKEAAVIGIPDEVYGELPKAFVVLRPEFEGKIKENELIEFVNSKVMDFKKLRGGLVFMSELPKSSLGKIDRKALKLMPTIK